MFVKAKATLSSLWARLKNSEERNRHAETYLEHLNSQSYVLHRFLGILLTFIWLGYAFDTDPKIHPDYPELLFFRLAFTFSGVIILVASFFPRMRGKGVGWVTYVITIACVLTGGLTGPIADDPNYVSGLQLIFLTIPLAPVPRRNVYIGLFSGLVAFGIGIAIGRPDMTTPQVMYSMNNLLAAVILSVVATFLQDYFRFQVFYQHQQVSAQKEAVQLLKEKQDGDYFLTSILIKPLMVNKSTNKRVKVDFFLEQYKKFTFKERSAEIGGDLCASHDVNLRGRQFTAYINADAMGKSIQGAGGALVLGTVFNAMVARSSTEAMRRKFPEQWLKECFLELQNVFVEFDGSMLISAVIGLIDEQTGLMYYINAEHPWVALYRDQKASFIEEELTLRKIGIDGLEGKLQIRMFQLQPGDVLFCGSDGRDDLVLGEKEGMRIINEDETVFLQKIEESAGSLDGLRSNLEKSGKLSDDLSLMRISFREDRPYESISPLPAAISSRIRNAIESQNTAALEEISSEIPAQNWDLVLARDYFSLLLRLKNYDAAMHYAIKISERHPEDNEFLYLTAYACKASFGRNRKRNLLVQAIDYGERLRLRQHLHLKNLINLADVYRLTGNTGRAEKLLDEAMEIDADNPRIQAVRQLLETSKYK